jgi:hypothetical protein
MERHIFAAEVRYDSGGGAPRYQTRLDCRRAMNVIYMSKVEATKVEALMVSVRLIFNAGARA